MPESSWTHIGILAAVCIPLFGMWRDLRHRQESQHSENKERLVRIETKVEPIWDWWKGNGH